MILETPRLRLRPYTLDDEAALFEVFADPYARRFYPEMEDRAKVRRWIEWSLENYERHGFGLWAMESRASGEFLGDCGLSYQEVEGAPELELGYHVLQRERGRQVAAHRVDARQGDQVLEQAGRRGHGYPSFRNGPGSSLSCLATRSNSGMFWTMGTRVSRS